MARIAEHVGDATLLEDLVKLVGEKDICQLCLSIIFVGRVVLWVVEQML